MHPMTRFYFKTELSDEERVAHTLQFAEPEFWRWSITLAQHVPLRTLFAVRYHYFDALNQKDHWGRTSTRSLFHS